MRPFNLFIRDNAPRFLRGWRSCRNAILLTRTGCLLLVIVATLPVLWARELPEPVLPARRSAQLVLNQVGYLPEYQKIALLINADHRKVEWVDLVEADSRRVVLHLKPGPPVTDPLSGDVVQVLDFTEYKRPGLYFLRLDEMTSFIFPVDRKIYQKPLIKLLRSYYLQRCGVAVDDPETGIQHAACHLKDGAIAHEDSFHTRIDRIPATGGWHDAGDYGKYVATTTVTIGRILGLYEMFPNLFRDGQLNIPESGNNVPDVLDEMRVGLEWLLRMQRPDGAVYRKLSGRSWPHQTAPEEDHQPRYVYGISTPETAKFAAVMAQAARIYPPYDAEFADRCLSAARKAWTFLERHPRMIIRWFEGDDSGSGPYIYNQIDNEVTLTFDTDDRLWAAVELWITTGEKPFHRYFAEHQDAFDYGLFEWKDPSPLALAEYWLHREAQPDDPLVASIRKRILKRATKLLERVECSGYRVANHRLVWGSNKMTAEEGITLYYAYRITGDVRYFHAAIDQLDYLLGRNPFGKSFVSGVGSNPVRHLCHLFAEVRRYYIPGLLVGGPNELAQAGIAPQNAGLLSYADHVRSYATNEYAIDYNASLIALMGMVLAEATKLEREPWKFSQ